MSDTMLLAVLQMPFDMAMKSELSRLQFHARAHEAATRIEALEADVKSWRSNVLAATGGHADSPARAFEVITTLRDMLDKAKEGVGWMDERPYDPGVVSAKEMAQWQAHMDQSNGVYSAIREANARIAALEAQRAALLADVAREAERADKAEKERDGLKALHEPECTSEEDKIARDMNRRFPSPTLAWVDYSRGRYRIVLNLSEEEALRIAAALAAHGVNVEVKEDTHAK